ncbi:MULTISPECIES: DUF2510 domain-containing protein [unclassified Microbacterium]|uniref:DUF2510 domain-containing protein n=1 Tax=unclassified Microbacterium TaxID=2609290 RepID=UPI0012FB89EF|nr:DUF2510 domain-containing protein [Microbacterium sp. MAH-37]MVQ41042.1 DUF2510 domain-containing protein [Microbacterium sp. MAH-37]
MSIPAGWYDDGSGRQRWWDGAQWTEHYAPVEAAPVPVFEPPYVADDAAAGRQWSLSSTGPATSGYPGAQLPVAYGSVPAEAAARRPSVPGWVGFGLSIAGLVLACIPPVVGVGLLVLLAAIVLSIIALVRPGARWPGVTGLIVSAVGVMIAFVVLFVSFVSSSFDRLADDPTSTWPLPSESAEPPAATAPPGSETIDWWELQVGDCLPTDQPLYEDTGELVILPCATEHSEEVFHEYAMTQDDFPGDKATEVEAMRACEEAFTEFVGTPYEESELDFYGFWPNEDTWEFGDDRSVQCIVYDPVGDVVTGSLRGAAR